tara:strand:+ start:488 stop:1048 length:561 start_codon:yes stop_codon:yes gene_type:complete
MVTEQEKNLMQSAMDALNFDTKQTKNTSKKTHVNPDIDAMAKILENFNSATDSATTKVLAETDIEKTITKKNDSVIVGGLYEVKIEKEFWNRKKNKNYYSVWDAQGNCVFENIALFESTMLIIKNLIKEDYPQSKKIYNLDQSYIKYLRDMRFSKKTNDSIMEAKYSNAKHNMLQIKEQLKNCFFE